MLNLLKDNKKLINEWNYEKNKDIDINKIALGSNKKVCGSAIIDTICIKKC